MEYNESLKGYVFRDLYEEACVIKESKTKGTIWIGLGKNLSHQMCLTTKMVAKMLPILRHYVETESIPSKITSISDNTCWDDSVKEKCSCRRKESQTSQLGEKQLLSQILNPKDKPMFQLVRNDEHICTAPSCRPCVMRMKNRACTLPLGAPSATCEFLTLIKEEK